MIFIGIIILVYLLVFFQLLNMAWRIPLITEFISIIMISIVLLLLSGWIFALIFKKELKLED